MFTVNIRLKKKKKKHFSIRLFTVILPFFFFSVRTISTNYIYNIPTVIYTKSSASLMKCHIFLFSVESAEKTMPLTQCLHIFATAWIPNSRCL